MASSSIAFLTLFVCFISYSHGMSIPQQLGQGGYPVEIIEKYLQDTGLTTNDLPEVEETSETDCIYLREEDKSKNCCTKTTVEMPRTILSNGKEKYVLQSESFQQKVKNVQCDPQLPITTSPDFSSRKQCFQELSIPSLYQTKCASNFGRTKLLVYDIETDTVDWEEYDIEVSCSCSIEK